MKPITRYFFAALPDPGECDATLKRANELQHRLGLDGNRVLKSRLNMTLHFLGAFEQSEPKVVQAALAAGDALRVPPHKIVFDAAMRFEGDYGKDPQRRPVMFYPTVVPAALSRTAGQLREALAFLPHDDGPTPPPHITFLYTADERLDRSQSIAPMEWTVRELCLVESVQGSGEYAILHRWPCFEA
ncbi:MAG: 2'-5' RNA ligase family protein [Sulfuricaulis sp.]